MSSYHAVDQGLVADDREGEADQDRLEGGAPGPRSPFRAIYSDILRMIAELLSQPIVSTTQGPDVRSKRIMGQVGVPNLRIGPPKRLMLSREGLTAQVFTETTGHRGNVGH